MEYWDLLRHPKIKTREVWKRSAVSKFVQLGSDIYGTNTEETKKTHFIPFKNILERKDPTYERFFVNLQP